MESVSSWGLASLKEVDTEIHDLIKKKKRWQSHGIELIASENFTFFSVIEALGSVLTNKYSEGKPGKRYYGGNEYINQIENLCRSRALQVFLLNNSKWGVSVQPYSGSPANFAAYIVVLNPYNHQIGALAVALKQVLSPGFKAYAKQVKANVVAIANYLTSKGYMIVTDGTEKHLLLWDLRPLGLTGNKVEKLCDLCNITVNKMLFLEEGSPLHFDAERNPQVLHVVSSPSHKW